MIRNPEIRKPPGREEIVLQSKLLVTDVAGIQALAQTTVEVVKPVEKLPAAADARGHSLPLGPSHHVSALVPEVPPQDLLVLPQVDKRTRVQLPRTG